MLCKMLFRIILRLFFQLPGSINVGFHCCCSPMFCWPLVYCPTRDSHVRPAPFSLCHQPLVYVEIKVTLHVLLFHSYSIVLQILLCMPDCSLCLETGLFPLIT